MCLSVKGISFSSLLHVTDIGRCVVAKGAFSLPCRAETNREGICPLQAGDHAMDAVQAAGAWSSGAGRVQDTCSVPCRSR